MLLLDMSLVKTSPDNPPPRRSSGTSVGLRGSPQHEALFQLQEVVDLLHLLDGICDTAGKSNLFLPIHGSRKRDNPLEGGNVDRQAADFFVLEKFGFHHRGDSRIIDDVAGSAAGGGMAA